MRILLTFSTIVLFAFYGICQTGTLTMPGISMKLLDCTTVDDGGTVYSGRVASDDIMKMYETYGEDYATWPQLIVGLGPIGDFGFVHKVNASGDSVWTMRLPHTVEGIALAAAPENKTVVIGFTPTDREKAYEGDRTQAVTVCLLDEYGRWIWSKVIPSDYNSTPRDVIVDKKGNIYVLANRQYPRGSISEMFPSSVRLLKLDPSGEVLNDWEVLETDEFGHNFIPLELCFDPEGNIMISGAEKRGSYRFFISRVSTKGKVLDFKSYFWKKSEYRNEMNWAYSISRMPNGYAVCGSAVYSKQDEDGHHLILLDENLNKTAETFVVCDDYEETRLDTSPSGEIYLVGRMKRHLMISKFDKELNEVWRKEWENTYSCVPGRVFVSEDGNVNVAASMHTSGESDWKGIFFRLSPDGEEK